MKNYKKKILSHCDLDLWPKVTNFNRVRASMLSNRLAKTVSKSVHPFGWNFVHKQSWTHTHTHTDTHTQTNWRENITPPRFRGGVIINEILCNKIIFACIINENIEVNSFSDWDWIYIPLSYCWFFQQFTSTLKLPIQKCDTC